MRFTSLCLGTRRSPPKRLVEVKRNEGNNKTAACEVAEERSPLAACTEKFISSASGDYIPQHTGTGVALWSHTAAQGVETSRVRLSF
jgi:hypothetical protein